MIGKIVRLGNVKTKNGRLGTFVDHVFLSRDSARCSFGSENCKYICFFTQFALSLSLEMCIK